MRIYTKPVIKARPRFNMTTKRTFTPSKTKEYEELIAWKYKSQGGKYYDDKPIKLILTFAFKVPKSYTKKDKEKALEGQIVPSKCDITTILTNKKTNQKHEIKTIKFKYEPNFIFKQRHRLKVKIKKYQLKRYK